MPLSERLRIPVLCGPTATGKTEAAIAWAWQTNSEIVSVDSGQIYRGMDIGTAKPTLDERAQARFHLIDIRDPNEIFSAADFERLAREAIRDIRARGKNVILCGGTGLYLKALEEGVFEGPSRDEGLRRVLEDEVRLEGLAALKRLHDELRSIDPEAASTIPFQNKQRLIRALEVYRLTGKPISQFWKEQKKSQEAVGSAASPFVFEKFALDLPKEALFSRIDQRVDRMMGEGLMREAERLLGLWGRQAPGLKIIGYKESVGGVVESASPEDVADLIKKNTKKYAKRQLTWFRGDPSVVWLKSFSEKVPKT